MASNAAVEGLSLRADLKLWRRGDQPPPPP